MVGDKFDDVKALVRERREVGESGVMFWGDVSRVVYEQFQLQQLQLMGGIIEPVTVEEAREECVRQPCQDLHPWQLTLHRQAHHHLKHTSGAGLQTTNPHQNHRNHSRAPPAHRNSPRTFEFPRSDAPTATMPTPESEMFLAKKPKVPPTFEGVDFDDNEALKAAQDAILREQWVKSMMARLVREEMGKCYRREGVNHLQNCGHLRGRESPLGNGGDGNFVVVKGSI